MISLRQQETKQGESAEGDWQERAKSKLRAASDSGIVSRLWVAGENGAIMVLKQLSENGAV